MLLFARFAEECLLLVSASAALPLGEFTLVTTPIEPPAPEPMPAGENYRSQEIDSQIGEVPVSFQNPVLVEVLDRQHAACA
jgi:hypothetical protein